MLVSFEYIYIYIFIHLYIYIYTVHNMYINIFIYIHIHVWLSPQFVGSSWNFMAGNSQIRTLSTWSSIFPLIFSPTWIFECIHSFNVGEKICDIKHMHYLLQKRVWCLGFGFLWSPTSSLLFWSAKKDVVSGHETQHGFDGLDLSTESRHRTPGGTLV